MIESLMTLSMSVGFMAGIIVTIAFTILWNQYEEKQKKETNRFHEFIKEKAGIKAVKAVKQWEK